MKDLYCINTLYLWVILIVLSGLNVFVGLKSFPNRGLLASREKYSRPMEALEHDPKNKETLFKSWDEDTKTKLRCALYWDFLFILLYPTSIIVACFIAGRFLDFAGILSFKITLVIILLQLVAALFDVIENVILLKVIDGLTSEVWLTIARISTNGKFGLIGLGLFYAIFGLLAWIFKRLTS